MFIKKITLFIILFFIGFSIAYSQEKYTLSGTITDSKNNETLIGVNIIAKDINAFAVTNEYGFYSISLPKGDYKITINSISFSEFSEIFLSSSR